MLEFDDPDYVAVPFSRIKAKKVSYLWRYFVPLGFLTVLTGESGCGKSTIMIDLIARMTRGDPMPRIGDDDEQITGKGSALILCQEDPADTVIKPRLRAAGADMDRVHLGTLQHRGRAGSADVYPDVIERLDVGVEKLERLIIQTRDLRVIFVDPITAFLGKLDFNREDHVRRLLRPLSTLAAKYKIAIVLVIHMNKDTRKKATQRILGSGGFVGANRSTLFVVKPAGSDRRLLVLGKGNNVPPAYQNKGVEFGMIDVKGRPRVEWGTEYEDVNLNAVLAGQASHVGKRDQAVLLLHEWLAEGTRPVRDIQQLALAVGFHWNTFKAAKKEIGIVVKKRTDGWWWALPKVN
ncbi:AAA family ATPase [Bradyrhizobium sp. CCBAU 11434]|uniref:AAA family ATPase n=1 Tax=Bradyrhizobium sp. CCBAU 11434 TaxID=1630885 RepID=UPI002305315F|nr:AAA family ATPase [Bradyrhizobium sp. CCBAU 11434]